MNNSIDILWISNASAFVRYINIFKIHTNKA
jgi:hypothetical protein